VCIRNKEWEMRNSIKVLSFFLLAVVFALTVVGCSKEAGPKAEDAIKAIQSQIESNTKGNTLKSPVVILERGKPLASGDFPFKVEYTISTKDGAMKKEVVTYNLSPSINDMGVTVWLVAEAK